MSEEFTDPVVRCTECQRIVTREEVRKHGMCPWCGNKRMRNVIILSVDEMNDLKKTLPDQAQVFLDEFEVKHG